GIFGSRSARALNRALALERERRKRDRGEPARREPTRGEGRAPARRKRDRGEPARRDPRRDPAPRDPAPRDPAPREPAQRDRREPGRREPARRAPERLTELVGTVRLRDAQTDRSWQELAAYASRRRRLLAELRDRDRDDVDLSDLAGVLLRIEDKLEALVELEQAEATTEDAEREPPVAASEPVAAVPAASGAGPAEATAEPETPAPTSPPAASTPATSPGASAPAAPPAPATATPAAHATNGGEPPAAAPPAPKRVRIADLADEELERRVERLDQAIGAIRAVLMKRYARAEKELVDLLPAKAPERPGEPEKPKKLGRRPGTVVRPREPRRPEPLPRGDGPPEPRQRRTRRPAKPSIPRGKPTTLSRAEVRRLQKSLNRFTEQFMEGVGPIIVDGIKGHATARRIATVKYHLGYTGKAQRSATVKPEFMRRMRHPRSPRHSNPAMLTRAFARRSKQRKAAKASAAPRSGVATFDGRPVAAWLKPYLDWARQNGWKGTLNSGFRDPAYSEKLCMSMCGAPSCPGRCAGRASNHVGSSNPAGAIDVSDYVTFGQLMRRCPYSPRIFNALGAQDPVHFSASGR
ncbi:MAG TPA: hypothetical protein VGW14_09755, partial [Thermoleophilaceae bacterium]|nr:hypothetical protein [Thermoleophilaceae bacterium]